MSGVRIRQDYAYVDEWKSLWEPDLEAIGYGGITTDPTKVDPKVLRWVKNNCGRQPHFIKVINPNSAHGRPGLTPSRASIYLYVPIPFVQAHFKELERVVTLENDDGKTWRVSFGSGASKDPRWCQGWARVAKDNNLKPGEVIVFVLVSNSHFRFTVFDEHGNKNGEKRMSAVNDARVTKKGKPSSGYFHNLQEPASTSNPGQEHRKKRKRLFKPEYSPEEEEAQVPAPTNSTQVVEPTSFP
ncbi:hypothetical protein M758_1G074200 [Ceratodon purpureus]|nr:hypothetical protein M758_1G074200 [Ceratodon purpureus]